MECEPGMTLLQTAVFLLHILSLGSGSICSLPEMTGTAQDYVSICAMCSDTDAAVRWTVKEDTEFAVIRLTYNCNYSNGTETQFIKDKCFDVYPNWIESHTGTTGVGHQLSTGVQCMFSVGYLILRQTPITKTSSCYIKSPEECAENPDECNIDRVSRLNETGECEVQCAAGYGGQLCNNTNECTAGSNICDDNAECDDTDGSYLCQCLPGFQGDGFICTNDECLECSESAECLNTEGNYSCQCKSGFTGDGYSCSKTPSSKIEKILIVIICGVVLLLVAVFIVPLIFCLFQCKSRGRGSNRHRRLKN